MFTIDFMVGDEPAQLATKRWIAGTYLTVGGRDPIKLQGSLDPRGYASLKTTREWQRTVNGHNIEITKVRTRLFGGLLPSQFTIRVDGEVAKVASR
ncbi:MAG: hypothetical protein WBG57_11455 [Ornithinimicrobium sp.]